MTFAQTLIQNARSRAPDFVIGRQDAPYLLRWYIVRNPFLSVYVHLFLRSDEDRALHDHPWSNLSILLDGSYTEHTIAQGGVHKRTILKTGDWRFRALGGMAHRVELHDGPCWTLFIAGPAYRTWGFHCPNGWVSWKIFTKTDEKGSEMGKGCGD